MKMNTGKSEGTLELEGPNFRVVKMRRTPQLTVLSFGSCRWGPTGPPLMDHTPDCGVRFDAWSMTSARRVTLSDLRIWALTVRQREIAREGRSLPKTLGLKLQTT